MRSHHHRRTIVVAAFAMVSLSATSQAAKTVLHGSVCQADYSVRTTEGPERGIHYWSAGIENTMLRRHESVTCPLPRLNGGSGRIFDLEVRVTSSDTRFNCYLRALDRFGHVSGETPKLYARSTGPQTLDFGNPNLLPPYEGSYFLACSLPPGAWIHSITVDQTL